MPRPFAFTFTRPSSPQPVECSGFFEDEEYRILLKYLECYQRLAETAVMQGQYQTRFNLKWQKDEGFQDGSVLPPHDAYLAFLYSLRPFLLNDEETYFYKVANILSRRIDLPEIRGRIENYRDLFSTREMQTVVSIRISQGPRSGKQQGAGVVINTEDILRKWLNAFEYHRDDDKRRFFDDLNRLLPDQSLRGLFFSMLVDQANAVTKLAMVIRPFTMEPGAQATIL